MLAALPLAQFAVRWAAAMIRRSSSCSAHLSLSRILLSLLRSVTFSVSMMFSYARVCTPRAYFAKLHRPVRFASYGSLARSIMPRFGSIPPTPLTSAFFGLSFASSALIRCWILLRLAARACHRPRAAARRCLQASKASSRLCVCVAHASVSAYVVSRCACYAAFSLVSAHRLPSLPRPMCVSTRPYGPATVRLALVRRVWSRPYAGRVSLLLRSCVASLT